MTNSIPHYLSQPLRGRSDIPTDEKVDWFLIWFELLCLLQESFELVLMVDDLLQLIAIHGLALTHIVQFESVGVRRIVRSSDNNN